MGSKNWKLGFSTGFGQTTRIRIIDSGDLKQLKAEIESSKRRFKLPADCEVASCYEAGRDGFWLHRFLTAEGIKNLVVDSASIEVNRRKRRAKSDRLDANSLVRMLMRLQQLRGIDSGAWTLVRELFGWRHFKNRRQVGSLAGLTPTPYQSGDTNHEQGISKAGIVPVRRIAIELAWNWLRYQPKSKLSCWYNERFKHAGKKARKIGIVALARRLLIEFWRYLETGVLPEGAELKAAV